MDAESENKIRRWLSRRGDTARVKRELVRIARDYILKCERYDQSLSTARDDRGWAVLPDAVSQEDSRRHARRRLEEAWFLVAEAGYDKAFFDQSLKGEAVLVETMSWDAYRTMRRPDFDS